MESRETEETLGGSPRDVMQLRIKGKRTQTIWLRKPTYLIGRSAACNVRIADRGLRLVHACLKVDGSAVRLIPQDDAPIRVNGEWLKTEAIISHGDNVVLGNVELDVINALLSGKASANDAHVPAGWTLRGITTALADRCYSIENRAIIGRAKECDIQLSEAHLSRRHAQLTPKQRGLEVEDLESANGTFVNGRRITKKILKSGDELSFDTLKFRITHTSLGAEDETEATSLRAPIASEDQADLPEPTVSTAIQIQQAQLKGVPQERLELVQNNQFPLSEARRSQGGWLGLMTIIALVGVLWGATSLLDITF